MSDDRPKQRNNIKPLILETFNEKKWIKADDPFTFNFDQTKIDKINARIGLYFYPINWLWFIIININQLI